MRCPLTRLLAALALSCVASAPAAAQNAFVLPVERTECDRLSLVVERTFPSDCGWQAGAEVEVSGSRVDVALTAFDTLDFCLEVVTTEVFVIDLPPLPAGEWEVVPTWTDAPGASPRPFAIEVPPGDCGEGYHPGDANSDGELDIADPVSTLLFLFAGRALACPAAGDVDASGTLEITDAVVALDFLFAGGPPFSPPFGECAPLDAASPLECPEPGCNPIGTVERPVWVARPEGCFQCLPCDAPGLVAAVEELSEADVRVLESTEFAVPVCRACEVCSTGIFYGALVPREDVARAIQAGWAPWDGGPPQR